MVAGRKGLKEVLEIGKRGYGETREGTIKRRKRTRFRFLLGKIN